MKHDVLGFTNFIYHNTDNYNNHGINNLHKRKKVDVM